MTNIILGTPGDDILTGTAGDDDFVLRNGGTDTVQGLQGNDKFRFGATFTAADTVDGGDGIDHVILKGDYSGANALVLAAGTMVNVEYLNFAKGHDYSVTTDDATVASGDVLIVKAKALGAGDHLVFDGSAETDGSFNFIGGAGDDTATLSANADRVHLMQGGNDTVHAGGGADLIFMGATLTAGDTIDGGAGIDTAILNGDYSGAAAVTLGAATLLNVEGIVVAPGHSYDITSNDSTVANHRTLVVDGSALGAGDSLAFDGSAETNGSFALIDGLGDDVLKGGSRDDFLSFDGGGTDTGFGGSGSDFFDACGHLDSADRFDGGAGYDLVELTAADTASGNYTGADALVLTAAMLRHFEEMDLDSGGSYDITTSDATVVAGKIFTVDASFLDPSDSIRFDGSAETDGGFTIFAGPSLSATYIGGAQTDFFDVSAVPTAGNVTIDAGAGDDVISFADNFDSSGQIVDGGAGDDLMYLDGDYSSVSLVGTGIIDNIETIFFVGGHDYTGIKVFNDVSGGATLTLDATDLQAGDTFEADATTTGNAIHFMGDQGTYTVTATERDDQFDIGSHFAPTDSINGGAGTDTLNLDGDYSGANALTFAAGTINRVDVIVLAAGHSYDLTTNDGNVAAAATLVVNAAALGAGDSLTFDGSAENDGAFSLTGGAGDDDLTGGKHADTIVSGGGINDVTGGLGSDNITVAGSVDRLHYAGTSESTGSGYDSVHGFNADNDLFDFSGTVTGFDGTFASAVAVNSGATFEADLALATAGDFAASPAGAHAIVLDTGANGGTLDSHSFLIVDADGDHAYTPGGTDYVIDVTAHSGTFAFATFI